MMGHGFSCATFTTSPVNFLYLVGQRFTGIITIPCQERLACPCRNKFNNIDAKYFSAGAEKIKITYSKSINDPKVFSQTLVVPDKGMKSFFFFSFFFTRGDWFSASPFRFDPLILCGLQLCGPSRPQYMSTVNS